MRINIRHETHYAFDPPAAFGLQQLRLTPKNRKEQKVLSWKLEVDGGRVEARFQDQFNNDVTLVSLLPNAAHLAIACEGEVDIADAGGMSGAHLGPAPLWLFQRSTPLTHAGERVRALVQALGPCTSGDVAHLHALSKHIIELVRYDTGHTDVATSAEDALGLAHGVCQDHTHVFLSAARLLGFPARYVSGYLMTPDRSEHDAGHAWAEAHVEALGWVGFDVSNGISPDDRYVRVSTGLDYTDAAPIRGLTRGARESALSVLVQVQQQQ
ncbi:MAG: transglutaminase family protein [Alphaproteobacteria bacterium]|nr:transglutaminase family protein [Alphaproteobacteria bacterium]